MDNQLEYGDNNLLESLNQHLSFLTDKFKVYESLSEEKSDNQSPESQNEISL